MDGKKCVFYGWRMAWLACALGVAGCATVQGPAVDKQEINEETRRLEAKALEYNIGLLKNVNRIGYRLVRGIPVDEIRVKSRGDIGLFVLPRNKATNRYFQQKPAKGVYIAFILEDTPMAQTDVLPGDVLTAVNAQPVDTVRDVAAILHKTMESRGFADSRTIMLQIVREGRARAITIEARLFPVNVRFAIVEDETVNAGATDTQVVVTKGLLNFAKSDDELAAAIAHELAHVIRGHFSKKKGGIIVNTIAAVSLGITAEVFVPGTGEAVVNGIQGAGSMFNLKFTRDLEREADYYGLRILDWSGYSLETASQFQERFSVEIPKTLITGYLNTHPNSPERKLRIEKSIEEIRAEKAGRRQAD